MMLPATLLPMRITSESNKEAITISIMQKIIIGINIIYVICVIISILYHYVRLWWHWHKVRKSGANLQKCMDEFFSDLPPRENQSCSDCRHSEVSTNNGNLICLNGSSYYFGMAVDPEQDVMRFCYSAKSEKDMKNDNNLD